MKLLVVGAAEPHQRGIAALASRRGIRLDADESSRRADWALVATGEQRRAVLHRYGLPPTRVIEWPALGGVASLDVAALERALTRMTELGPYRPVLSKSGVALIQRIMPWLRPRLVRMLAGDLDTPEVSAPPVWDKAVRQAEKEAKRVRSERKHQRAVEKRARQDTNAGTIAVETPVADPRSDDTTDATTAAPKVARAATRIGKDRVTERQRQFAAHAVRWNITAGADTGPEWQR
jgi:hypothetical protein